MKTVYFASKPSRDPDFSIIIDEVVQKRDKFLVSNKNTISHIHSESIQFETMNIGSRDNVVAIITLSYFPKL